MVRKNLKNSFPNKSELELKNIEKKFYHHFFDVIVESIKSISISENQIRKRVVFENIEMFDKYSEQNKSVVLAVSHYGNWEWGILGISINAKQKMMGVYKKFNNAFFDKFMNNVRSKFGANLVEMNESIKYIINNNYLK